MNFPLLLLGAIGLWQDPAPLLNVLLRSGLLLAVALGLGMALRGGRPETRALIYRAGLLCALGAVLLGPVTTDDTSRWNIRLYSSTSATAAPVPNTAVIKQGMPPVAAKPGGVVRERALTAAVAPLLVAKATARDNRVDGALTLLLGLWPVVSLLLLVRLGWCHLRVVWIRWRAEEVREGATLESLRAACAAIGVKVPQLWSSSKARGPFLCGIWRPMILLPGDYAEQFDAVALRAIFLHEAAHIRGRDCAWTYARRIASALLWPQPLLWVLSRQMEVAGEEVCDLAVLEGGCAPRDYARCLVDLAERLCLTRAERTVGAGVVPRRSILPRRVEQILKGVPKTPRLGRGARWTTGACTLCLCAGSIAFAIDTNTPIGAVGDIRGRVVYEDGRPAGGVGIAIQMQDADETRLFQSGSLSYGMMPRRTRNMLERDTTTAADGTYRIQGLLAGATFNVMVHNGLFGSDAGPQGWVGTAQMINPQKNKNTGVKDIVLTHGAFIEGRIEDALSGKPLAGMSFGCHGPHRPLSTGYITGARSDSNGHFTLRVPLGKNWIYWNGPTGDLWAEVRFGSSEPYEKHLSVVRSGEAIYGASDFVEVRVEGHGPRYTRSGNGGLGEADSIVLKAGQTGHMTFRLTPLHIKERPGKSPLVIMSDTSPLPNAPRTLWNPDATLPAQGKGTLMGRVTFPDGKPAASVALIVQMQNRAVESFPNAPAVYSEGFQKLSRTQKAMLKQNIITGADGTYRVTGLLDAPYDIVYTPTNWGPLSQWIGAPLSNIQVRQNGSAEAPDMVLQHGTLIQGHVTDATSKRGIAQTFLVVDDRRRPPSIAMSEVFDADKNGRFSFRVLPGLVNVSLNFYDASPELDGTIQLGSHRYDWRRSNIRVNGQSQKLGSTAQVRAREGQSLNLDFGLPPVAKNARVEGVR